ncbi:ARM repeat superfamily protein [Actinidia rufa]|uniref:RING-type E3 ubiquitin transferase n=1 Tax=Actinidia rufa TaxID=165716 RepID=A0A7J0GRY1_9ERIC|nr:ARM repeat superfamily protein [Actinidia rufa]
MVSLLKLLKPVLDDVVDDKIPSDDGLYKECEELDIIVNEGREFVESWSLKMSKICSVLKSEELVMKMQHSSQEICRIVCRLLQSLPSTSCFTGVQELQCLKLERVSECIEEALKSQREGRVPPSEQLTRIIEFLGLTANQELLKESIALEKERERWPKLIKRKGEIDQINNIIELMSHIRDCMVKVENFRAMNGVCVPSYFRCPLSLKLMFDPVIVASGQTYDRASIQKWLDNGLYTCPKTRQMLSHTNLIPNYTVKALIANWCDQNHIKFSNTLERNNTITPATSQSENAPCQDLIHTESFRCSSHSNDSTSRSSLEVGNEFQKLKIDASFRFSEEESNGCRSRETENFDLSSSEQSYVHSRTESASKCRFYHRFSACSINLCIKDIHSKTMAEVASNGNSNYHKTFSLPSSKSGCDDVTTTSHVEKLVEDLKSQSNAVQTSAAAELRFLAKHNTENRVIIGCSGAIALLLSLLYSEVKLTQEHAVTAVLNLSINENVKAKIAEAGAIEPLIHVLRTGIKALVDLLHMGTLRGKKDAATALFNLSIFHENKARIIQAGAVKYLVELMDPATEMVDKAVALLANLSTITEGCTAIVRAGGIYHYLLRLLRRDLIGERKMLPPYCSNCALIIRNSVAWFCKKELFHRLLHCRRLARRELRRRYAS